MIAKAGIVVSEATRFLFVLTVSFLLRPIGTVRALVVAVRTANEATRVEWRKYKAEHL